MENVYVIFCDYKDDWSSSDYNMDSYHEFITVTKDQGTAQKVLSLLALQDYYDHEDNVNLQLVWDDRLGFMDKPDYTVRDDNFQVISDCAAEISFYEGHATTTYYYVERQLEGS